MSSRRLHRSPRAAQLAGLITLSISVLLPASAGAQIVGGRLKTHLFLPSTGVSGSSIGDLDLDGTPDYAIGTSFRYSDSTVTVYSGRTRQQLLVLSRFGARFGHSVAGIGDANRDGYPDLLVGAPEFSPVGVAAAGSVFVFSGKDGDLLRQFDGQGSFDYFGTTVADAGDLNLDGAGDYLVSAPQADPGGLWNAGSVYVFSGDDGSTLHAFHGQVRAAYVGGGQSARDVDGDGIHDIVLTGGSVLAGGRRLRVYSGRTFDELWSVPAGGYGVGIGDVNRDGRGDIASGNSYLGLGAGEVVVYSGVDGSVIHRVSGRGSQGLGTVVGWTGDVNRDGHHDFAAGDGNLSVGAVSVFSGRDGSLLLKRFTPTESISGAGDLNGDGFPDVLSTSYFSSAFVFGVEPFMAPTDPTGFGVSAAAGRTIDYAIDFPRAAAGDNYLVLMSASGIGPFTFGVQIPLTVDALTIASLQGVLAPLQTGFFGTLSSSGNASASLLVPPALFNPIVGVDLQLAAVAFPSSGALRFSSSAIRLGIRP